MLDADHPCAGLRQRGETGAGDGPRHGHADAEQKRQRERDGRAFCVEIAREEDHLNHDRGDARARQQRRHGAHHESDDEGAAALFADAEAAGELREVDGDDVEHRERQRDEQHGDAEVEPRRRVDRPERPRREDHDQTEHSVDEGHGDAVDAAEGEAAAARTGLRAGADDREIDGNHREHAGRQVEREAAEQHEQRDRDGPTAVEHPALRHAGFGIVNERYEGVGAHVPAGRSTCLELLEQSEVREVRGVRDVAVRWCGDSGWRLSAAEGDPVDDVAMRRRRCRSGGNDLQCPGRGGGRRREARRVVAGLITNARGNLEHAGGRVRLDGELDANRKRPLEHRQRLAGAGLFQIDWRGKDNFLHRDAGGRVHRQLRRNEIRIAGLVRLDVVAVGNDDRQRGMDSAAGVDAVGVEQGSDLGFDALQLRTKERATTKDTEGTEKTANPLCPLCPAWCTSHFTSLSGITATGAGGSDESSTVPLTGGRSWNMKSHFQRSDGLLASSQ